MEYLIGVDEAGYGPNYGPLVVAATAWRVADAAEGSAFRVQGSGGEAPGGGRGAGASLSKVDAAADLYRLLRKAVRREPDKAGRKLAIADSKALYSPQLGLRQLERGVLAALATMRVAAASHVGPTNACIGRVAELLAATLADGDRRRHELPCHANDELELPLEALAEEIERLAALLSRSCAEAGVTLVFLRARLVFPAEFNALVERWGSKGAALSHVTMELVRRVVDGLVDGAAASATSAAPRAIRIFFDKHGGRSRYAALVQHHFSESWIEPVSENRNRSRYRWMHGEAPVEAVFRVSCEELLPTALASMAAKYHREVVMRAFNEFWTGRVPGLRPTAGYPGDSERFRREIAAVQAELGIDDRVLWRSR
jgi:hypothetical protein